MRLRKQPAHGLDDVADRNAHAQRGLALQVGPVGRQHPGKRGRVGGAQGVGAGQCRLHGQHRQQVVAAGVKRVATVGLDRGDTLVGNAPQSGGNGAVKRPGRPDVGGLLENFTAHVVAIGRQHRHIHALQAGTGGLVAENCFETIQCLEGFGGERLLIRAAGVAPGQGTARRQPQLTVVAQRGGLIVAASQPRFFETLHGEFDRAQPWQCGLGIGRQRIVASPLPDPRVERDADQRRELGLGAEHALDQAHRIELLASVDLVTLTQTGHGSALFACGCSGGAWQRQVAVGQHAVALAIERRQQPAGPRHRRWRKVAQAFARIEQALRFAVGGSVVLRCVAAHLCPGAEELKMGGDLGREAVSQHGGMEGALMQHVEAVVANGVKVLRERALQLNHHFLWTSRARQQAHDLVGAAGRVGAGQIALRREHDLRARGDRGQFLGQCLTDGRKQPAAIGQVAHAPGCGDEFLDGAEGNDQQVALVGRECFCSVLRRRRADSLRLGLAARLAGVLSMAHGTAPPGGTTPPGYTVLNTKFTNACAASAG